MEGSTEIQTISKIVNHLQNLQYIQTQLLNSLSLTKEQDLSCYIGLINLLFNLALQYHKKGKQNAQHSPNENIYVDCSAGNILHLRGEILKEYGKLFMKLFHQPAYSFAKLDYQSFNSFCSARGLSDLIRSSRGIYPQIDPTKKKPLQFLPNYRECIQYRGLIGNNNWEQSKKIVKKYYNDQIKKNNVKQNEDKEIFNTSEYLKQNKSNKNLNQGVKSDQNLQKGIKMFFILLTQSYEQFDQSIKLFQYQCAQNQKDSAQDQSINTEVLDRLKFWFENYKNFVQDGVQLYLSRAQLPNFPLLSHFEPQKFEDIIIQTIEKLFYQITNSNSNTFAEQTKTDIEKKLNSLIEVISEGSLIPQTFSYPLDYDQSVSYQDSNRMLMLSYTYMIHKLLFPQDQQNNLSKKIYMTIQLNQNPIQQPFNRVFYSDQELLSLYQSRKLKELPTFFRYSPEISIKILKLLINKNPSNLFHYLQNFTILKPYQRLKTLINSKLIGDVSKININVNNQYILDQSQYQNEGQRLLSILAASTNQYKPCIRNHNQKIDMFTIFINDWRQFYNFYRNFNENYLSQFLLKFKTNLAQKSQVGIQQSRNYLIPSDFILPHQRKDSFYHIINKFVLIFEQDVEKFTKMLEEMDPDYRKNDMLFKNAVDRLTRYVKIIMSSEFKQILNQANPNYSFNKNQLQMESQGNEQKLLFQDRVWKIYAEAYLLLNQYSKKLLMNNGIQQKKNPMITKTYPGQGQITSIFGGRQNQGHYIHEIDDDDDDEF